MTAFLFFLIVAATEILPLSNLGAPSGAVPPEWLTRAEQTDFQETGRYDETIDFCRRLAEASDWIELRSFGKSPLGRDLPLVIAASGGEFDPEKAKASGKPIVLIQNAIHSGECDGKDAALMLLRDIAVTRTRADLLQNTVVLVIPIYNVDGHERFGPHHRINQNGPAAMGWRTTASNLNLNRDYMKADAPETRAWMALFNEWQPHLHIDTHTTDGGDWQYDIMLAWETSAAAPAPIAGWLNQNYKPNVLTGLSGDGHEPAVYFDLVDSRNPEKGIASGPFDPRFSNGYVSLRNRASILVESHMLKPHRTRVLASYSVLSHSIELAGRYADTLKEAVAAADAEAASFGKSFDPQRKLALAVATSDESQPFTFKGYAYEQVLSELSGTLWIKYDPTRPALFGVPYFQATEVSMEAAPPVAYIIPPQWTDAIEVVAAHGLRAERLSSARIAGVESYRLSDPKFAARPFEGRFRVTFKSEVVQENREFPAGSLVIPLDQPAARVAVHLLEPHAPDSLASWGFFNAIFEQKEYAEGYVLEKLARDMLAERPELKAEFEARIASDPEFAKDPRARLYFFYQRSPYWDQELGRYPVARLLSRFD